MARPRLDAPEPTFDPDLRVDHLGITSRRQRPADVPVTTCDACDGQIDWVMSGTGWAWVGPCGHWSTRIAR